MTDYRMLESQLRELQQAEPASTPLLANAAALLWQALPDINWAGFYLLRGEALALGPFQGRPACIRIPRGRGVCGTALAQDRVLRVPDVHAFPGHIACDSASRSELVVPLHRGGVPVAVLDLDSPVPDRFAAADESGLRAFAQALEANIVWEHGVGDAAAPPQAGSSAAAAAGGTAPGAAAAPERAPTLTTAAEGGQIAAPTPAVLGIEHAALYFADLEGARDFFVRCLGARSGARYDNRTTGFSSFFLTFAQGGARVELMHRPGLAPAPAGPCAGYAHMALRTGSRQAVDALTQRLQAQGCTLVSGPRVTGDGCYESCVLGFEGCVLELTV